MRIRPAVPPDWPVLRDIEVRAGERFRALGMHDVADDEPPSEDALAAAAGVLVAVDHTGELVGYARIELIDDTTHLEQLSVPPEHGGRGVGTALLDAVTDWARRHGHEWVTLTTFRAVPFNAPLYAKRGFEELPETAWADGMRALVAEEAAHGLDPATRVVMRRRV